MATEADIRMEMAISRMLRLGVSLAALVVSAGAILYLWQAHGVRADYRVFHGVPSPADHFAPMIEGIRHHDSREVIHLGLLLLIATPIMRVAFCVYSFARQKDKLYVLISGIVLTILLLSFFRP